MMGKKKRDRINYPKQIDMKDFQNKEDNIHNQITKYNLFGITEHMGGSDNSGHYTAHTLREGNWYSFDDEYFKKVKEQDAMNCEAYLLFYSRL
jgi:ubiquitin C-terminal hydrolase